MAFHIFKKTSLILTVSLFLAACGSGDSGGSSSSNGLTSKDATADSQASSSSVEPTTQQLSDNNQGSARTISVSSVSDTQSKSLACNKADETTACGLITYQVMVESFINSDHSLGYGTAYGSSHHQGDLQGIIDSLDYIKSLGANAIWLTPIFESKKNTGQDHWATRLDATGYFTTDYFKIDPNFGDLETARELVESAHAKGLYVFFDGVFGHHKGNVISSPNGNSPQGGSNPVAYPGSLAFYKEVATYWVKELKIDGWRLDQAYQVPVSYWTEIREAVEQESKTVTYTNASGEEVNPLAYMVAEIWQGAEDIQSSGYGPSSKPALKSAFNFPLRYSLVQTLAGEEWGFSNGRQDLPATNLATGFTSDDSYEAHAMPNLMLTNHDLVRFGDLLQRAKLSGPELDTYWARHKAAFSFMTAYSGPITLYYGDEIGDQVVNFASRVDCDNDGGTGASVGHCDDHVSRNSGKIEGLSGDFVLNENQTELKNYVSQLMQVRQANPALYNGSRTHIYSGDELYIDLKEAGDNKILYLLNTKNKELTVNLSTTAAGTSAQLLDLLDGMTYTAVNEEYNFTLAPFEALLLKIEE